MQNRPGRGKNGPTLLRAFGHCEGAEGLVCRAKNDLAPRTHALLRLAELSGLNLRADQRVFLSEFDRYQRIEGRYPDNLMAQPSVEEAHRQSENAREIYEWLMQR
jgi:HEPN domain-containing protein